jgi:hypothetical protein
MPKSRDDLQLMVDAIAQGRYSRGRLVLASVAEPSNFRDNVVDQRLVTGSDIVRTVGFGFGTTHAVESDAALVVCFIRPVNERLISGLHVTSATGRTLPVLSVGAAAYVIAGAIWSEFRAVAPKPSNPEWISAATLRLLDLIREQASQNVTHEREAIDAAQRHASEKARRVLESVPELADAQRVRTAVSELIGLVAVRQPLLVDVPEDERGYLRYVMRESLGDTVKATGKLRHRAANVLGAVPGELGFPLYKGTQSCGYTLEVDVGEGNLITAMNLESGAEFVQTGVGTQLGTIELPTPLDGPDKLVVSVAEHPSKTTLSALILSIGTFAAVLLAWLARDRVQVWQGQDLDLGDLAAALGLVAIAGAAVRSVIYSGLQGRVLAFGALASAAWSSVLLIVLGVALAWPSEATRSKLLFTLLVAAMVGGFAIVVLATRAVVGLVRLRRVSAAQHPERPTGA